MLDSYSGRLENLQKNNKYMHGNMYIAHLDGSVVVTLNFIISTMLLSVQAY